MAWLWAFTAAHMHDLKVVHTPPEVSSGEFIWNYEDEKFEVVLPYFDRKKLLHRQAQLAFDKLNDQAPYGRYGW